MEKIDHDPAGPRHGVARTEPSDADHPLLKVLRPLLGSTGTSGSTGAAVDEATDPVGLKSDEATDPGFSLGLASDEATDPGFVAGFARIEATAPGFGGGARHPGFSGAAGSAGGGFVDWRPGEGGLHLPGLGDVTGASGSPGAPAPAGPWTSRSGTAGSSLPGPLSSTPVSAASAPPVGALPGPLSSIPVSAASTPPVGSWTPRPVSVGAPADLGAAAGPQAGDVFDDAPTPMGRGDGLGEAPAFGQLREPAPVRPPPVPHVAVAETPVETAKIPAKVPLAPIATHAPPPDDVPEAPNPDLAPSASPPSLGLQVSVGLAELAASSVEARRPLFVATARTASDLEGLEPQSLGSRRTMLLTTALTGPTVVPPPVVAQVAADLFRLQTARLDQLMASRAADEDGEPPPLDADEVQRRARQIKEVDLGPMWRWDLTPRASASGDASDDAEALFRTALLTLAMQAPAVVLPMFGRHGDHDCVRVFVPHPTTWQTHWQPMPVGPSWLAAAAAALSAVHPEAQPPTALQALVGRPCDVLEVVGDAASSRPLWKALCQSNSPRQVPMLVRTVDHTALGVLGTFVRDDAWMVSLCDAAGATNGTEVFSVPFAWMRRNVQQLVLTRP